MILLVMLSSLVQAALSTMCSLAFAVPLSFFFNYYTFPGKRLVLAYACLLGVMPPSVIALCLQLCGVSRGLMGIVVGHVLLNVPFAVYLIYAAYRKLDRTLCFVAHDLGACGWRVFWDVEFPFLLPTLKVVAVTVFLLCFSSFSLSLMMGNSSFYTLDVVLSQYAEIHTATLAVWISALRLLVVVPLLLYVRGVHAPTVEHVVHQHAPIPYTPVRDGYGWLFFCMVIMVLMVAPCGVLVYYACSWQTISFFAALVHGQVDAVVGMPLYLVIARSVAAAVGSSVLAVVIGVCISSVHHVVVSRWLHASVFVVVTLPFLLGNAGCGIVCSWLGNNGAWWPMSALIASHVALHYAFVYRAVNAQLVLAHSGWSFYAQQCGATWWQRARTLYVPFVRGSIGKAFCLVFGFSLSEAGAGGVLSKQGIVTLPVALKWYRAAGYTSSAIGLCLIVVALMMCVSYGALRLSDS